MAADKGDPKEMQNYAILLKNGDSVPLNKQETERYIKMADEIEKHKNDSDNSNRQNIMITTGVIKVTNVLNNGSSSCNLLS